MANFYLSHWNDTDRVFVPANIVSKLKSYQFPIVRSLYGCFQKKFPGIIINYDDGINICLAFQALGQALINAKKVKLPFLIIASDENLIMWHYHLCQIGKVFVLNNENCEEISAKNNLSILLTQHSDLKLLKPYCEVEFSLVIVEDFDKLATKILFKKLGGEFNIALTKKDFMFDRDCKVLWNILNWVSPGQFGKLNEFSKFDHEHMENLRNPYDDIWYTFNYDVGEHDFEETKTEEKKYKRVLEEWALQNGLPVFNLPKKSTTKRKHNTTRNHKSKVQKQLSNKSMNDSKTFNTDYHEQETQLVGKISPLIEDNTKLKSTEQLKETKALRDVSDLSYEKLIINEQLQVHSEKKERERSPFQATYSNNLSKKRKSFEFMEDVNKNKLLNKTSKRTENNPFIMRDRTNNTEQHEDLPLLEDIPACKQKVLRNLSSTGKSNGNTKEKEDKNGNWDSKAMTKKNIVEYSLGQQSMASLEEVFKCKTKSVDSEHISRKSYKILNVTSEKFNCLPVCSSLAHDKDQSLFKNSSSNKSTITKPQHSMVISGQTDLKRVKLCGLYKIIYKNILVSKNRYKRTAMVSKQTQTNDNLLNVSDKGNTSQEIQRNEKDVIDYKDVTKQNLEKVSENKIHQTNETKCASKCSSENNTAKYSEESQKDGNLVQTSLSRNSTYMYTNNSTKNEDDNILLSIIEGKFTATTTESENHILKQKVSCEDTQTTSASSFSRNNSKILLESLYGDQTEYIEDEFEEKNLHMNNYNEIPVNSHLKYNSQSHSHLKVKTIDQINDENSDENSDKNTKDIHDEFKDNQSTFISESSRFNVNQFNKHNLISSLFG